MNDRIVGRCSLCGGAVTIPIVYWGVGQPQPTCRSCGATMRQPVLPMVPMQRRPQQWHNTESPYLPSTHPDVHYPSVRQVGYPLVIDYTKYDQQEFAEKMQKIQDILNEPSKKKKDKK